MGRLLIALGLFFCGPSLCTAQLPLVRITGFTNAVFGSSGTVGVAVESTSGNIVVLDFDQPQNVHVFTPAGWLGASGTVQSCMPSLPSPNGLAQDRSTGTFWLVDNHNGMPVMEVDAGGSCLGGWNLSFNGNNPMSIVHHGASGDLFVGSNGAITRWTRTGQQVGVPLYVSFPSGSWIVGGLAWLPGPDHLLVAQSGGTDIFEIDLAGNVVSVTSLLPWGITNVQGLDYDPTRGNLVVTDNASVSVHVFDLQTAPTSLGLSVVPGATYGATMSLTNLPAATSTGWTLASSLPSGVAGTGMFFGLTPDSLTALLVTSFPTPVTGSPVHWDVLNPQVWPFQSFTFAPGTFFQFQGMTWDFVAVVLDGNGVGLEASNVVRTTF